ncbi:glycosyltransferase [Patescibacteria group bacterium]|nr:glycosyltransferase [Patescibacteria group bacterium]MBU1933850.1 glycosyltransferase [Patescibacteria group bacterium]MBU2007757.1 glycosyltransferase [Patescibacteria group bacterium]MBU2233489.1 glycosyltransferase [Patescibacteria group bacterium]MBU2263887.1 glycosyltransferase [Patescibacteria group bacterium]
MKLAPIALFVYNRLWHTQQTIEALQKNILAPESDLIVFSDGPKDFSESKASVLAIREYLKTITGFKSIKIIAREKNNGLAQSIITGVSEIINQYGKIIVLEDDMISSQYFLQYMNEALDFYETEDQVISIHAYIYPVKKTLPETYFLKGADCWGWATWKRGWNLFEPDGQKLLKELETKKLTKEFDFSESYPYTNMLRDQIAGKNNSWAIRWYASAFLKNKLTLYSCKSLIDNIGLDGSGTHCSKTNKVANKNDVKNIKIEVKKIEIKENNETRSIIVNYFKNQNNVVIKILKYLKNIKHAFKN